MNKMNKINERLNVARDALTKVYKEFGATTFSKMILNLRDENVLDELANEMGNQYRGVMQEARDYGMTYPSYKVEEFNTIGDMAQNGILNLLAFAEQHKPELASKLKSLANDVTEVIYDDMEEFDTQPRIRVKENIKEQVEEMVKGAVKVFQKEGGALGIKALEDGLSIDTKKAKALLKTMIKRDLVFLHRDGDYILKEGHGLTADDIKVIEKTIDDSSDAKLTDILKFIVSSNIEQAKRADLSKGK
jgi:phenolic acid decarboxylase